MTDGGDWRLMGRERYLTGRSLRAAAWFTERADWDHDHCEFCFAEIWSRASGDDEFDRGYVTADDEYQWICEQCFADFRDKFSWTVVPSAELPIRAVLHRLCQHIERQSFKQLT